MWVDGVDEDGRISVAVEFFVRSPGRNYHETRYASIGTNEASKLERDLGDALDAAGDGE